MTIRALGGHGWISKTPILLILIVVAIFGLPQLTIPLFAFAGVLIYVGILLILKAWKLLKDLHWLDYIFTILIGLVIVLFDFTTGFVLAMVYAGVFWLIQRKTA